MPFHALAENTAPPIFAHPGKQISDTTYSNPRPSLTQPEKAHEHTHPHQVFTAKIPPRTPKSIKAQPDIGLVGVLAQFGEVTAKIWLIHLAPAVTSAATAAPIGDCT